MNNSIPPSAITNILRSLPRGFDAGLLADLCERARSLHGELVGEDVCYAINRAEAASARLATIVASCATDPDPSRELARTQANSGDDYFGDELYLAGINSTRGQAACAAAQMLFKTADFADVLLPTIEALANDPIVAVRACAAEAVMATLNVDTALGLDFGEQLFSGSIDVLGASRPQQLLGYLAALAPDRFGPTLVRGLAATDSVAHRAGRVWAHAFLTDKLPSDVPGSLSELSLGARRGAARVFGHNVRMFQRGLIDLFDDDDEEVRGHAASALRDLDTLSPDDAAMLLSAFIRSASFSEHISTVFDSLDSWTSGLPEPAIEACERALEIAGPQLGDFRTNLGASASQVVGVVLRLYRQSDPILRSRCLDLIDQMTTMNLYDLDRALDQER